MGTRYQQLSLEDRCTIARLHAEGRSLRQIAASVDCAPSTVSREQKRNASLQKGYLPAYAQDQTKARRTGYSPETVLSANPISPALS
jgi:IS30 family transposase